MKTLLLLRHAKSDWSHEGQHDHDRTLNARGKRDAHRMGQLLMSEGLVPDAIISSDAKRARKTTQRVVEGGELTAPVIFHSTLYLAPPQSYIHVLQQQRDTLNCILMVGHNPGIEELSHLLTGQAHSFPTATLAEIELPLDHWADLELETTATLRNLWRPRELDD